MEGFIALHRKMTEWEWYTDTNVKAVFLHCLLKANYERREWRGVIIERGEFITSVASLGNELGLTAMQIRRALDCLQSTNEITIKTTNKYSVVTICNYENYQDISSEQQQTKQQTTQQTNNKQDNKQTTTTKQINNITNKQYKEKSNTDVLPKKDKQSGLINKPTIDEIRQYCEERNNDVDAERFFAYYEANGWKVGRNAMKDWRAAVRTWERKDGKRTTTTTSIFDVSEIERIQQEAQKRQEHEREQQRQAIEAARQADIERIETIIYNHN